MTPTPSPPSPRFLSGDSEMAARMRAFPWDSTPLGPPATWPTSLRTLASMLLSTRHPAFIFWGAELICLYNDAYSASLGPEKHPYILGTPGKAAFPEIWDVVGGDIERVAAGGAATWHENQLVPILRNGRLEEVYWTYSYAGIEDESAANGVGGVLVLCTETTSQVLAARRANQEVARLGQLFDQAPVFMAVLSGPNHVFEFANPSYRRLIGDREVVGQSVVEALPEVVKQGFIQLLNNVYENGEPYAAHGASVDLLSEGGRTENRRLDFVYQPTRDAVGAVNGILVVGVDVTSRANTEQALLIREEQLRLATDVSEVGFWDVDPIADTLFWPSSVRRMFGIFTDRPVSMTDDFYEGLHPEDRAATVASYAAACDPSLRGLYDVEYRTIGKEDGRIRWVAAKGRGLFDGQGRCVRVIGTAIDVSERKRDEARLLSLNETLEKRLAEFLAERKLFADIVEGSDALIQVLDKDFRVLASNRANAAEFERRYGLVPLIGTDLLSLLSALPAAQAEARRLWSRALANEAFVEELETEGGSLGRRWYEYHFQPLSSPSGELVGAFQFGFDVTSRHHAEERLAETEAALQQAQRMEVIGLLTGGVAHDFNNVLQALNTKFELIRRKPDNPDTVRAWATGGVEAARRGARVTAQLLAFSRQQSQGQRPIRLKLLLDNLGDLLRTTLGPQIHLEVDIEDVWVQGDPTQLEMALLNLVVNAKDAMAGSGRVAVAAKSLGDKIELSVTDTGAGMSPELIGKAFTPFFTTKELGKGSGLGLAQVNAMATRAGGTVRIVSDGCSGSAIIVSLLHASPGETDDIQEDGERSENPTKSLKVLVVDDDASVRASLVELLRGLSHRVVESSTGEEALKLLEGFNAEVLLCDLAMPGMNGATVAVLAKEARPELKVVFMSGYADAESGQLVDAIGQNAALLRKPFDADTVQRTLLDAVREE